MKFEKNFDRITEKFYEISKNLLDEFIMFQKKKKKIRRDFKENLENILEIFLKIFEQLMNRCLW